MAFIKRFFSSRWAVVPLLLLALWGYFPPYADMFVGDDYVQFGYVAPFSQRPLTLLRLFNPYTLTWYYRPLQNIWFVINRLVLGVQNPIGYYYILLTFHLLAIALAYRVARQLRLDPFWAFCCAALFGLAGHHTDTVGWISSVAIVLMTVFTLAAVSAYLAYRQRPSYRRLFLTALFFLLTLLTHEEAILLPPLLLAIAALSLQFNPQTLRQQITRLFSRAELLTFAGMFALTALYIYFQATRPNLTISLQETPANHWLAVLSPFAISDYLIHLLARFSLASDLVNWITKPLPVAFILVSGLVIWFWEGGPVIKLGLFWAVSHLAFIYLALWSQKPELLAGRHLYNAYFGLVLAIMSGLPRVAAKIKEPLRQTAVLLLLAVLLATHAIAIRETHNRWYAFTREDLAVRTQMKQLLPTVTESTHIFAYRFPITPNFLHAVSEIWYDRKIADFGGPLDALEQYGQADPTYYVFDYADGRLYNLMPELQKSRETHFIWHVPPVATIRQSEEFVRGTQAFVDGGTVFSQKLVERISDPPPVTIAGPATDRRIAVTAVGAPTLNWSALAYTVTVPLNSQLEFGILQSTPTPASEQPQIFRVWLIPKEGAPILLHSTTNPSENWQDVTIPMQAYSDQTVELRFEVRSYLVFDSYWSNIRFTVH